MPIDASLFAHIENDFALLGTYKLQGNRFVKTTEYLSQYLDSLTNSEQSFPPEYSMLLQQMKYVVKIEHSMEAMRTDAEINKNVTRLATSIVADLMKLPKNSTLSLPGGWQNNSGGHAMIYQLNVTDNGIDFTAINAGAGLEYHAKKSARDKELYNPMKTWRVPRPNTSKEQTELVHFIGRLLQARLPSAEGSQKKAVTEKVLYEEILPSISYIGGEEVDANVGLPLHAYTGGQLSGTCAQRVLHQMLKILSKSAHIYQNFILKFKLYALYDYADACFKGEQPFNLAVADQIHLAIENNLKILNTPRLFNEHEIREQAAKLGALQTKLNAASLKPKGVIQPILEDRDSFDLASNLLQAPRVKLDSPVYDKEVLALIGLNNGEGLLKNMSLAVKNIQKITDPATQYYYLEQLLLELPLNPVFLSGKGFYRELRTTTDLNMFQKNIDEIQTVLLDLQEKWLQNVPIPTMNVMLLSIASLQIDVHRGNLSGSGLPDFTPFSSVVMESIIGNQKRNPFIATNHPGFDKKFKELQDRYIAVPLKNSEEYYAFFDSILKTEPELNAELKALYQKEFAQSTEKLHHEIRKNQLESLFMIEQHHNNKTRLSSKFAPVINKIEAHLAHDSKLKKAITPFYVSKASHRFALEERHGMFYFSTALYPIHAPYSAILKTLADSKYAINTSPAKDAFSVDLSEHSCYYKRIIRRTANDIQLKPVKSTDSSQQVTQADIVARDYFHLRSEPSLQIALTIDYFTRHMAKLSEESNQRYVEGNLFQPGLLLPASIDPAFLPQFDTFLTTGNRFFTHNGLHTRNSLFFLRLDYLVSRYLTLNKDPAGLIRLKNIQEGIEKQLSLTNNTDVTYALQQYLFLTLLDRMNHEGYSDELFSLTYQAYFYINSHTNPSILEDQAHHIEVDCAKAKFQYLVRQQPNRSVQNAVKKALIPHEQATKQELVISGEFPIYELGDTKSAKHYQFNALAGQLFERGLARVGIPLTIQNHSLIKHLGLHEVKEGLMTLDETHLILTHQDIEVRLFYENSKLTVCKDWTIGGIKTGYELQALTKDHLAQQAHSDISPISSILPKILTDGSMDYWKSSDGKEGILVQNNIPMYSVRAGKFYPLDSLGNETGHQLSGRDDLLLKKFESEEFRLTHLKSGQSIVQLPRYNLNFNSEPAGIFEASKLINQETGELVVKRPSPIHSAVAGLVMVKNDHARYLVPVGRFYATLQGAEVSDFYPVVHDISGAVAHAFMENLWKKTPPIPKPMWQYKNSEKYISFRLKDGEPIADTVADALYLVYIYLSTNQPEKAWKTLEECNTRLGGLTGNPAELQFIAWICQDLPHILPIDPIDPEIKKSIKKTPPYVACQLKAMSLLCDHLTQGGTFDLKSPNLQENTANAQYEKLQQAQLNNFLTNLPGTLYQSFTRLQNMRRHLNHTYTLSTLERKRLLGYYHQRNPKDQAPQGALGFEWMSLSLESLLEERDSLLARHSSEQSLSPADKNRLDLIQSHLKELKPVVAQSTALELVAIDLNLPANSHISWTNLKLEGMTSYNRWSNRLPGASLGDDALNRAVDALSSEISEDDFIAHFPAYLQLVLSDERAPRIHPKEAMCKKLQLFCTQTLIAKRHVDLSKQDSNIPLLCNVLYRAFNNKSVVTGFENYYKTNRLTYNELVTLLSPVNVPPLKVYQAKDIYQDILATPEDIMVQQERPKHAPLCAAKKPSLSLIAQIGIEAYLIKDTSNPKRELDRLIEEYNTLQERSDKELAELAKTLTELAKTQTDNIDRTFTIEDQAGTILFALEKQKRVIADYLIKHPELTQAILSASFSAETALKVQIEKSWADALNLANQGPADPARARTWSIEKQAKLRATLNKACLLSLYSHADRAYSIEKTGLSPENAQRLHDLIHTSLIQDVQAQSLQNISSNLNKALTTGSAYLAAQALEILARKEIPGLDEPSIVIIQHEEKILLRKRQVSALQSLLEDPKNERRFRETIEKIIPGGGKSKVILPILAERKAQGDNLVVLEVPRALLETNHIDLNRTSQNLFGKRAYRLDFNRDSDCSPERLEQIYQLLIEIMTTRSYLVTAGESIQSLELKYVELLLSTGEHDETWKKQVYWCDKITNLFRHHTDCIIDEVHQGLSIKKKLNYTSGESKPLSTLLIKNATALFSFIDSSFIKEAPSFDAAYDWTPFKTDLATKLINHTNSPLNTFVAQAVLRYGSGIKAELIAYLTNSSKTTHEAILNATPDDLSSLAFFKQEINVVLPQSLTQKLDKQYGPSKKEGLSAIEKTLAIPYAGSNVPNERNRFANELESINKNIQMMLLKGINEELLIERISEWQASASQELFASTKFKHSDETPTAQGFALLTSGLNLKLSQVDIKNSVQMTSLYERLKLNRSLILDLLREHSLKLIKQDNSIITSDNFNHVDIYRSVQATSGTPTWNSTTYHQRLSYDKTASLGSDGYIREVIRNKKPVISSLEYDNAAQFIKSLLTQSTACERTRSIIDIKGTFTGVSNLSVAQEIAFYIRKNPTHFNKPIQQVLYFNDKQVLCAININKPEQSIVLGTSDAEELNRLLNSTPGERFTYYDQIHTTGTDITQEEQAHSIVLIDDKTDSQEFLQGAMRYRGLPLEQTMELIVPPRLKALSLEDWYTKFDNITKKAIETEAPSAAKGQMRNHIRRIFLSLIQDLPSEDAEKKAVLIKHFRPFFEDNPSLDLFALYGGINKKQTIENILAHYQRQLKILWETCLTAANLKPFEEDIQKMNKTLKDIIDKAVPYCLAEYESSDDSVGLEVEVQSEVQTEVEREVLAENETYNASFRELQQLEWKNYSTDFARFYLHYYEREIALPLNQVCRRDSKVPDIFSPQLMASRNYAETYQGQREYTGAFLKPVFLVWYHLHNNVLHAMIVTPQEAKELEKCFKGLPSSWLSTTQDTLIAGNRPDGILLDARYQTLREQVRFFNGEFVGLLNQQTPLIWMKEDPVEKMTFFESQLLPSRPGSAAELHQLHVALTQGKAEGFAYIAEHPFEDLTQFNWLTQFPKTIPAQAAEYKRVAETFMYLNQNWRTKTISFEELQQEFRLPLNSLVYVNAHLTYLATLKQIQQCLKNSSPERPFLLNLSEHGFAGVEECLRISVNRLYELGGFIPPKPGEVPSEEQLKSISIISIQILNILQLHPALPDKHLFIEYFEASAKQTTSKEVLHALLNIAKPTDILINNIIEHSLYDDSLMSALFALKIDFTEEQLLILVKQCKTSFHIELLLKQENLPDTILHALLGLDQITDAHLFQILGHAKSEAIIERVALYQSANPNVREGIFQHPLLSLKVLQHFLNAQSFTVDELLMIIKNPNAMATVVLKHMMEKPSIGSKVLLALVLHDKIPPDFIPTVLKHLPLSDMINMANEEELGRLIHLKTNLSSSDVIEMAKRTNNTLQIDALLARPEMTSEIANILFQKVEYSGTIANWSWLTADQLQSTLDQTCDYDSLVQALTHSNLSKNACEQWVDRIIKQQKENSRTALASNSPQQKLMSVLEELKIKAVTHAIKATDNEQYKEVARTAFGLYQSLYMEFKNHFNGLAPDAKQFKANCQEAINRAKPVLEVHRGYKQLLLDIVNLLFSVAALIKNGNWRFFEAETASMKTVNKITECIFNIG